MSTTVIVLIVIGLIFIFVSFALSEKLSEEKEESAGVVKIPKELTQEQKEKIDTLIRDYMDQQVDGKLADIETRLAEIVNQKTLALGDYAVSVNEEIDRNHKEVVFLYDMLSDKQKEIMTTVNMIDEYKKEIASIGVILLTSTLSSLSMTGLEKRLSPIGDGAGFTGALAGTGAPPFFSKSSKMTSARLSRLSGKPARRATCRP